MLQRKEPGKGIYCHIRHTGYPIHPVDREAVKEG